MSEDNRRQINKQSTGTVPKVKCRNNYPNERSSPRSWTNNLAVDSSRDYSRNTRANPNHRHPNFSAMDQPNQSANSGSTPNTSSSASRRNSANVPKCDNLTKYPDKKQIEDKLAQIREYLQITSHLMTSMKNTDDQSNQDVGEEKCNLEKMTRDLKDSEAKLLDILEGLEQIDDSENNNSGQEVEQVLSNGTDNYAEASNSIDCTNLQEIDQQIALLSLQQKAENKMKDARQIQEKLRMAQFASEANNQRNKNQDLDSMINDLEDRTKHINSPRPSYLQDKLLAEVDSLQNQLLSLHKLNDDRHQLIEVLDNRDTELRQQHHDLQAKLTELQTKKIQVDSLVGQLQHLNEKNGGEQQEEEEGDVGQQVRRICTMKEQLSKLKDMLEIVKTTEGMVQTQEEQELACDICAKAENFLHGTEKLTLRNTNSLNKNTVARKQPKEGIKEAIQAELEAKKRELEDIMGKHKAGTSNLNHDVGCTDNKSEFSCASNFEPGNNYSSDECPDYTDFTPPVRNYQRVQRPREAAQPAPNPSGYPANQMRKQLELIRSVCDAMLVEENPAGPVQQLRNNLTPSPLYSEPPRALNIQANDQSGWLASNNLQTQAFMLNTLNQCCQMLWLQQRELINLRTSVGQMQERFDLGQRTVDLEEQRRANQAKINQVVGACSMPNLNQFIPVDASAAAFNPMNNVLNGADDPINNSVLHGVNANINQVQSIWNGQALNNQVAPGNRANNYWDNFRSYSRQNLLSTKSNEGIQNMPSNSIETPNQLQPTHRTNPFSIPSLSKSNSEQAVSVETTPRRRRAQFVSPIRSNHIENRRNSEIVPPPDVLNINRDINVNKSNETIVEMCRSLNAGAESFDFFAEIGSNTSNLSEGQARNEWHEEHGQDNQKSKLFEELRENVYKEVVNLISSNEARPHFLIQLFRDLQLINSDPLRLKILQNIQNIISHSVIAPNQVIEAGQSNNGSAEEDSFSFQSTVWSKLPKNASQTAIIPPTPLHLDQEMHNAIKEIIPFLNDHEDETITHQFLQHLKQALLESEIFHETVRDTVFKKHFSNVLDELLSEYHGKKVRDVKMHVIQTLNDLLKGELSFIQLIQDTCPENSERGDLIGLGSGSFLPFFETSSPTLSGCLPVDENGQVMQNGDLAEADQSRLDESAVEDEDEGAVGGFWDLQLEPTVVVNCSEEVDIDYPNSSEEQLKQGLDQVPTRLPTKSRSNTPSKDRSSSSRSNHPDQF